MAAPNEKLAASLSALRVLSEGGRRVFQSSELARVHRERLLKSGFLQPVIKGWLIVSSPSVRPGDSTAWYASFWEFCSRYCNARFGSAWHLSPEQSLLLHAEKTAIPKQVIVYTPRGTNNSITLPHGTSLYDLKDDHPPPSAELTADDGLRLFAAIPALIRVPEGFFQRHPLEARLVLAQIRKPSALVESLLVGAHSVVAGRLAGALRHSGQASVADQILAAMKAAGYDVRERSPFAGAEGQHVVIVRPRPEPPIVGRIQLVWQSTRASVLEAFPIAPGPPVDPSAVLRDVDQVYQRDAYHSLSIEGYRVTPDLVRRVQSGDWDPETRPADRESRDALAARGYWQAFQRVKASLARVIHGENPGKVIRDAHHDWYLELFQPCVAAGLVPRSVLAGYRRGPVFLRGSRHVPPRAETVRDAMIALLDLLEAEPESSVRAVLGHWLFGYIHPYVDGNGRIARFVMNVMLAAGGYPWTVITVDDRSPYLNALEHASIHSEIKPFATFLARCMQPSKRPKRPPQKK